MLPDLLTDSISSELWLKLGLLNLVWARIHYTANLQYHLATPICLSTTEIPQT